MNPDRVRALGLVGAMAAVMWVVEVLDQLPGVHLDNEGIRPQDVNGLDGILFAPFLHASFAHLIGNTLPFLVLGAIIALSGLARTILVTVIVMVAGGLAVWLFAPAGTDHIGASGVVFGYAGYLVTRGLFDRSALEIVTGGVVGAIWGGALLASLVPHTGISWQGHLCGGIAGVIAAWLLSDRQSAPKRPSSPSSALDRALSQ